MNKYLASVQGEKKELKGPVTMEKPNVSDTMNNFPSGQDYDELDNDIENYEQHLASLPVAFTNVEWLKQCDDGRILEEGKDFRIQKDIPSPVFETEADYLEAVGESLRELPQHFRDITVPITKFKNMETKEVLEQQLKDLENKAEPIRKKIREMDAKESKQIEEKIKRCRKMQDKFTLEELRFSAGARCACGAGLAYPIKIGMHGEWECSDILLGRAIPSNHEGAKTHDSPLPFAFYSVKSEGQPSANGQTTRPKE